MLHSQCLFRSLLNFDAFLSISFFPFYRFPFLSPFFAWFRWVSINFELIEMEFLKIVYVHHYFTPRLLHDCFLISFSSFTIHLLLFTPFFSISVWFSLARFCCCVISAFQSISVMFFVCFLCFCVSRFEWWSFFRNKNIQRTI